jgi:uncharacterized protein YecE (DUF72 family)
MDLFETPATPPKLQKVRVGTSGYSFKDWVGPFYPPGTRPVDQLRFYARRFDCLEVNVTYYRIPDVRLLAGMAQRTPDGFAFVVKLHGDMTHRSSRDDALYREFRQALVPLQERGCLHGLLAQFPFRFRNTQPNRAFVAGLRDRFPDQPLYVEFRHNGWILEATFDWLRNLGIGYVAVDEPQLSGLVPPVAQATTDVGYVRLHGRNEQTWFDAGPETGDRYDYLYRDAELREWAQRIRDLAQDTRHVFVFFNNCHAGKAPANAQAMQSLLAEFGL